MDYIKDKFKVQYCNENIGLDTCKCIFPPEVIKEAFRMSPNPYYCFYEKCKGNDIILTSEIEEGIKNCSVTNCIINIGDLEISGSSVKIRNKCVNELDIGNYFKLFDLDFKKNYFIKIPIFLNIELVLFLIVLMLLLINIKY